MIHLVPELVQGSLINQALEISQIVAATFKFSDSFKEKMRNIPQNYIEKAQEVYSDLMFKAFEAGMDAAKIKEVQLKTLLEKPEEMEEKLKLELPLPYGISTELKEKFEKEMKVFFETVPNSAELYSQFSSDLECAYFEGAKEHMEDLAKDLHEEKKEIPAVEPAVEEEEEKEEEEVQASAAPVKASMEKSEILRKIEEYTKLLGDDPVAEKVLRATMGLPPKETVMASVVEEPKEELPSEAHMEDTFGPFDAEKIKVQVLESLKTFKMDENDEFQVMVLDKLLEGVDKMDPQEAAKALCIKLEIDYLEGCSFDDICEAADILAEEITNCLELPGHFVLMELNGDFVSAFTFEKKDAAEMLKMEGAVVTAAKKTKSDLPGSPMGALGVKDSKEIEALWKAGKFKHLKLKDIKKASPKVAQEISDIITDFRNSKISIDEFSGVMRYNLAEFVEKAFGLDGYNYLKMHLERE